MGATSSAEQQQDHHGGKSSGQLGWLEPPGQDDDERAVGGDLEEEEPEELLQKNEQISSLNGIAEEPVVLSLKPEELDGQQAEVVITDVGQIETAMLKETSVENMEITSSDSSDKTNVDDEHKDTQDVDKLSLSLEDKTKEQEQPSESSSNMVGFKKVFKLVGFKFTLSKDKTVKVEPVQLLNVKTDDSSGAGDCKEVKKETMDEGAQNEMPHPVEKSEEEIQVDQREEESLPEKVTESLDEVEDKQEEVTNDDSKSSESPTSPITTETASPFKKFFTQGWAGFKKKTSFRKPKEQQAIEEEKEEQAIEEEKEEQAIEEEKEEQAIEEEKEEQAIEEEKEEQAIEEEKEQQAIEKEKEQQAIEKEKEQQAIEKEKEQQAIEEEKEEQAIEEEKEEQAIEEEREEQAVEEEKEEQAIEEEKEEQAIEEEKEEQAIEEEKEEQAIEEEKEEQAVEEEKEEQVFEEEKVEQVFEEEKVEQVFEEEREEQAVEKEKEEQAVEKEKEEQAFEEEKVEQAVEEEKEEQEKETVEETTAELEKEKTIPEQDQEGISVELSSAEEDREGMEKEKTKMLDASTYTYEEIAISHKQISTEDFAEYDMKQLQMGLKEKIDLILKAVSTHTHECLMDQQQSTLAPSEEKPKPIALLRSEVAEENIDQYDIISPTALEKVEEPFEIVEVENYEPKTPAETDIFNEKPMEISIDSSTIGEMEEPKKIQKEELVLEQLVEAEAEIQREQPIDEKQTRKETSPEEVSEHPKQIEPSSVSSATSKLPEAITNEVELLSSQERAKIHGSPLKKLFTTSSLKKLSGKKQKGKKEEVKPGEAGEQMQQFSDSAESPEEPRAESSASSPEDLTDSVEKADGAQITETEDGSTFDVEKKRESVKPWASFKKMVTPKKRVRRPSESDKEDELDKAKNANLSSTESAPSEEQEDTKENGEEQKLEKSTEEPKKKVDTSVSWEALICVGSSKKRSRKSSSDEEVGHRLAQEGQKIDEGEPNKGVEPEVTLTSSQESDQQQGSSSSDQIGSPSEGEGASTWESFKRLVTSRKKSKPKAEERSEESARVLNLEHSTSDADSGKEESWVSFKKLMPGRRKKKSNGVSEHAPVQEIGEEMAETNEEDSDVPAVVPLSEYEAAEQEKFEAQMVKQDDIIEKSLDQEKEKPVDTTDKQSDEELVHAVTVTVVEGERAVTSIEERSPSWISAVVTEAIEDKGRDTDNISETEVVKETVVDTKPMPEIKKDISGDTIVSELTSEAITAREEPSGVEEGIEVSCAEETTEMVSAVSRLSESPDTTKIATPVQEFEETQQDLEELNKKTQEILQEVVERVKVADEVPIISEYMAEVEIQPVSGEKPAVEVQGVELSETSLKKEEARKTETKIDGGIKSDEGQAEVKESGLKEILEQHMDVCMEVNESAEITSSLNRIDELEHPKTEQHIEEEPEKTIEEQTSDKKSEDDKEFVIFAVTPKEEQKVKVDDTIEKQQVLKEVDSGEYGTADTVQKVKINSEAAPIVMITENIAKLDEFKKVTCEEKPQLFQKEEKIVSVVCDLKPELADQSIIEIKKPLMENEDAKVLIESLHTEKIVLEEEPEKNIEEQTSDKKSEDDKTIDVPVKDDDIKVHNLILAKGAELSTEIRSAEEVAAEACIQSIEIEMPVQKKTEPESQLKNLETKISVENMTLESLSVKLEEQVHAETVEKEMLTRKLEVDVHKPNAKAEDHSHKITTNGHLEEVERKPHIQRTEEVLTVEPEVKDAEAKTECTLEKPDAKEHVQVAEANVSVEELCTTLAVEVEEVVKIKSEVELEALTEKIEVEPTVKSETEEADVIVSVEPTTETSDAKLEVEVATEEVASKVDLEVSTEKLDAKIEAITAEMVTSSDQMGGKLDKDVPVAPVPIESHVETAGIEVAKEKSEVEVPPVNTDVEHLAKEIKEESFLEKSEAGVSTKKAEAEVSVEKVEVKPCVEVFAEKVDAKVDAKDPAKKVDEEGPAEQSKELVEAEVTAQQLKKKILEKVEKEIVSQTDAEDAMSLATCAETVSPEVPIDIASEQESMRKVTIESPGIPISFESNSCDMVITEKLSKSEEKDGAPALEEVSTVQAVTEEIKERELGEKSTSKEDTVDLTQAVVGDAGLISKSQIPEQIKDEAPENKEKVSVKDVAVVVSESAMESITQKEISMLPSKTEEESLTSTATISSEGHLQSGKESELSLESKYTKAAEDTVQTEAPEDITKKEHGEIQLTTESYSTEIAIPETIVEGSILASDSRCLDSVVSNALLESKGDSTPLSSSEAGCLDSVVSNALLESKGDSTTLSSSEARCLDSVVSNALLESKGDSTPLSSSEARCLDSVVSNTLLENKGESTHLSSSEARCLDSVVSNALLESKGDSTPLSSSEARCLDSVVSNTLLESKGESTPLSSSEARCLDSVVSNALLESKGDSTLSSSEAGKNGISVLTETCPNKLALEAIPPVLESTAASDSCQIKEGLLEKVQIMGKAKSTETIELAVADSSTAPPIQQEIFTEQQEVVTTGIPEVQSCEAHKSTVTVTAAAIEEQIIAGNVTFTETPTENLPTLPEKQQETGFKMVQQVSYVHSEGGAISPADKIISEKVDSTVEETVSPAVSSTKDDLLQKCVFHSIPETKHQTSETSPEAKKKKISPNRSPTLTHIEFQKDVVQSVTIESQSTKIVLKIIQNAVDQLDETEEEQNESHPVVVDKSETQPCIQTSQQPVVKGEEEKSQEIQASSTTQPSEKQLALKTAEETPLHSEKSEDRKSLGSSETSVDSKAVKIVSPVDEQPFPLTILKQPPGLLSEATKEIVKEKSLQKENSESKVQSEEDAAVSRETQRPKLEVIVSEDLPKESLELTQPKLKDNELRQPVQTQEQLTEQQTQMTRKEDHSPSTGSGEGEVNNQDCTSCKTAES